MCVICIIHHGAYTAYLTFYVKLFRVDDWWVDGRQQGGKEDKLKVESHVALRHCDIHCDHQSEHFRGAYCDSYLSEYSIYVDLKERDSGNVND